MMLLGGAPQRGCNGSACHLPALEKRIVPLRHSAEQQGRR
jgi:hypothetical protein